MSEIEEMDDLWSELPFDGQHMLSEEDMEVLWVNEDESDAVLMLLRCRECGNEYRKPCSRPGATADDMGGLVLSRCPKCLETGAARILGLERGVALTEEEDVATCDQVQEVRGESCFFKAEMEAGA